MATEYHDDDLLRVHEFVAPAKNSGDGRKPFLRVSRSKWLSGVKKGIFPQPVRLGARGVFWRFGDLRRVREQGKAE